MANTFTHRTSSRLVELYIKRKKDLENRTNRNADACRKRKAAWSDIIADLAARPSKPENTTSRPISSAKQKNGLNSQAVKRLDVLNNRFLKLNVCIKSKLFNVGLR